MKKFLFLFLFAILANFVQAQLSDEEAKEIYQNAEDFYDDGNFYGCYSLCNELIEKMGKMTPKTLYLKIQSIYNNLENSKDKSVRKLNKSYRSYISFLQFTTDFFSMVDKSTYPIEKYNEILQIQSYFQKGLKDYEYEKDRKPEDAINFLNDCAKKFAKNGDFRTGAADINFMLDSSQLIIDCRFMYLAYGKTYKRYFGKLSINLKKVWIETTEYNSSFNLDESNSIFYNTNYDQNKKNDCPACVDESAPFIMSIYSLNDNDKIFDDIQSFQLESYEKNYSKVLKQLESITLQKSKYPFYIYELFSQLSEEFKRNNYRQRIYDAFDFLINYFGGGTPMEKKQERKSKF